MQDIATAKVHVEQVTVNDLPAPATDTPDNISIESAESVRRNLISQTMFYLVTWSYEDGGRFCTAFSLDGRVIAEGPETDRSNILGKALFA